MRIAYLTPSYPLINTNMALYAEKLARGTAQRGHQTLVITASERRQAYRALAPNLTVMRLAPFPAFLRVGQKLILLPRRATLRALIEFAVWGCTKNTLRRFNTIIAPTPVIAEAVKNRAGIRPERICYAKTKALRLHESLYAVLMILSANHLTGILP